MNEILQLAQEENENNHYEKAIALSQKALQYAEKDKNTEGIVKSYFRIAYSFKGLEMYKESLEILKKIETQYEPYLEKNQEMLANVKSLFGNNYLSLGFTDQADKMFLEMLHIAKDIKQDSVRNLLLFRAYLSVKAAHQSNNHADSSSYYLNMARSLVPLISKSEQTVFYYSVARFHLATTGNLDSATWYNQKGKLLDSINKSKYYLMGLMQSAIILNKQKRYQESLDMCFKVLPIAEAEKRNNFIFSVYNVTADNYKGLKNLSKQALYLDLYKKKWDSMYVLKQKNTQIAVEIIANSRLTSFSKKQLKNTYMLLALVLLVIGALGVLAIQIRKKRQLLKMKDVEMRTLEGKVHTDTYEKIVELAAKNSPDFLYRFSEKYPSFINALLTINPELQPSELIFCAYLKLNFSTKVIATYMFITPSAVQNRKNRIRKRLNIPSDGNIYIWISDLGS
ncbi:hypothetical protein LZQ00_11185 [Sphingobacterium sp. SRCM116780]|uniref:helix-turn-helix transcriptional regulator n=1 Tax=Sphingobacterium sp. SRCM116780 TaxID=2907623 RepID=UPI001F452AB2|nr:hypothetical protein [Sphingobacterium sp. SRCM116780]UIR54841.1 hypothetical protein LZQ00_11185 [Sphingobacterium sp. SRCM116780]